MVPNGNNHNYNHNHNHALSGSRKRKPNRGAVHKVEKVVNFFISFCILLINFCNSAVLPEHQRYKVLPARITESNLLGLFNRTAFSLFLIHSLKEGISDSLASVWFW